MDSLILLERLRNLLQTAPGLEGRGQYGQEQFAWLGKASALISAWDRSEAIAFSVAVNGMTGNFNRLANHGTVFTLMHKAIASLEEAIPSSKGQAFGPGAAYDFFRALRELLGSAEKDLLVVDPFIDAEIFDGYVSSLAQNVNVRLLLTKYADSVRVAASKFRAQSSRIVEVKKSGEIHDRVVFIDGTQCWVLGASIKDAATKKPTYLAPLSSDIAIEKVRAYEAIWSSAAAI